MTQPIDYRSPDMPVGFANRKSGLLAAGIVMIVLGALAGCVGLLAPVGLIVQQQMGQPGPPMGSIVAAVGLYGVISVALIWTGIGSIQARRWVRPIVLCVTTLVMAMGVLALLSMLITLPMIGAVMRTSQPPGATTVPSGVVMAGVIVGVGVALVAYLVIPLAFFMFYRSLDVARTVEYYDPHPRWTDGRPLPVLGTGIALALFAVGTLTAVGQGVLPVFGILLTGMKGIMAVLGLTGILALAAFLVFRQEMAGWWMAVVLAVLIPASWIVTMLNVGIGEIAAASGTPPAQAQALQESGAFNTTVAMAIPMLGSLAALIFLFRVRHYFTRPVTASTQ